LIGLVVSIAFVFAQYYESKNTKKFIRTIKKSEIKETEKLNEAKIEKLGRLNRLSNLIFNDENYDPKVFKSKLATTFLLTILAMGIGGYSILLANFMLTYTTKGPAKLSINTFFYIQMLFWIFTVFGRLLASIIAYKLHTIVYFLTLIMLNMICVVLFSIPFFNSKPIFYWIIIIPLSAFNGPIIPSSLMLIKYFNGHVSSFIIAILGIGMATGAIAAQYLTSFLLDEFKTSPNWFTYTDATSSYIIPIIILINISLSFLILILSIIVFYCYRGGKSERD
jgi:MFS family permease